MVGLGVVVVRTSWGSHIIVAEVVVVEIINGELWATL